jgi:hypothetical protein
LGKLDFKVQFENFYPSKITNLREEFMCELDKMREFSLFLPQTIPQKTPHSFISQNVKKLFIYYKLN